jgi:hypothetical protein
MEKIPKDILLEIVGYLPLDSFARFRTVSLGIFRLLEYTEANRTIRDLSKKKHRFVTSYKYGYPLAFQFLLPSVSEHICEEETFLETLLQYGRTEMFRYAVKFFQYNNYDLLLAMAVKIHNMNLVREYEKLIGENRENTLWSAAHYGHVDLIKRFWIPRYENTVLSGAGSGGHTEVIDYCMKTFSNYDRMVEIILIWGNIETLKHVITAGYPVAKISNIMDTYSSKKAKKYIQSITGGKTRRRFRGQKVNLKEFLSNEPFPR